MYWNNIRTYYKSILYLFLFCITLNIPILLFINPIVNWLTSFSDIDAVEDEVSSNEGYITFILFSLINLPMFITLLNRYKIDTYTNFITNHIYEFSYFLIIGLLCYVNPAGLITGSDYGMLQFMGISVVIIGLLKNYKSLPIKELLLTLLIISLSICGNNVVYDFFKDTSTYVQFIIYVLFYILGYVFVLTTVPISERIEYAKIKLSTLTEFIGRQIGKISSILVIEIVIILIFFYVRSITKTLYGGDLLIHEPISLNKTSSVSINDYQYQYSLSFWTYINATSPAHSSSSSEYTDVMVYGDNLLMAYNGLKNKLQIIMKNENDKITETIKHVPLQKWNHFVLSYTNGVFDIFMNGELVKTHTIIPQLSTHEIIFGSEDGVNGDICNVLLFKTVLSKEKINSLYSRYKFKNPPIL